MPNPKKQSARKADVNLRMVEVADEFRAVVGGRDGPGGRIVRAGVQLQDPGDDRGVKYTESDGNRYSRRDYTTPYQRYHSPKKWEK